MPAFVDFHLKSASYAKRRAIRNASTPGLSTWPSLLLPQHFMGGVFAKSEVYLDAENEKTWEAWKSCDLALSNSPH
jgi:hypothetical protein